MGINQLPGDVTFTHNWYRQFLTHLQEEGYEFAPFLGRVDEGEVLLRHDVDLSLRDALTMAKLEAELGVTATYCIQFTAALYNPLHPESAELVREIKSLGHDVGLHFSTHAYWEDDPGETALTRAVNDEREMLETITGTYPSTVSFHRPPPWVLDRSFAEFENTYAPPYLSDVTYVADSNQRWRQQPPPIRTLPPKMQLLTHPGLWAETDADFEGRIERAAEQRCRHVSEQARKEFIDGV